MSVSQTTLHKFGSSKVRGLAMLHALIFVEIGDVIGTEEVGIAAFFKGDEVLMLHMI